MKKPFHILILVLTLLWICVPPRSTENNTTRRATKIWTAEAESGPQVFLLNYAAKADVQGKVSVVTPLPDPSRFRSLRFSRLHDLQRSYTSFIAAHHIYTQVTSSYL